MTVQSKPLAFAGVAERLGKLIPRLASDHDGEVVATVAAIGRTLRGAGLDWHDLAQRVADPIFAGGQRPTAWPRPSWNPPPSPAPPKSKPEPSPWPTFGSTTHARRKLWLKAITKEAGLMSTVSADVFKAFRDRMVDAPTTVTTDDTRLFNRLARAAWEKGIRVDRAPPPWPTWGMLSHFGRIEQFAEMRAAGVVPAEHAEQFAAFADAYYRRGVAPGPKLARMFNAACRALWERGAGTTEKAA